MPGKNRVVTERSLSRLSDLVGEAGIRLKPQDKPASPVSKKADLRKPPSETPVSPISDEEAFLDAMNSIPRASWRHDPHPSSQPAPIPAGDSDSEANRLMQTAIEGFQPVPVLDHPEYIEGWIGVAGKKFLPRLRNGLYSIQGQIDLHGYNRIEAQIAVEDYIARMSRFQSCCIKIIHGRGINSPTDKATLKESLQRLLRTRRMSRYVVAYASAPSFDGGVGAVYVLLRRQ
jgi:DNA-nicking Smr family endonuclease